MAALAGGWRRAVVAEIAHPYRSAVVLRLAVPDRIQHLPGQHYVIRLTAPDGYTASRSYSVSSPPSDPLLELYIERIAGGEVSGYLGEVVEPGDELKVRGPIGGWFVWDGASRAVGIGGGTGVTPLVAMLRHARAIGATGRLHLAVAARTRPELPYADELTAASAVLALSREAASPDRPAGRLTGAELAPFLSEDTTYYLCGSSAFTEAASDLLMGLAVPAGVVRVERFGPSG